MGSVARRAARVAAGLCLAAGLALAGHVLWLQEGTTRVAQQAADREVAEFYDTVPPPPDTALAEAAPPVLHTDFDLYPPPEFAPPASGTWGVLHVPAWKDRVGVYGEAGDGLIPVAEGATPGVLGKGWAGHFAETADVGRVGNFALAGHRRTYGQNFLHVPDLRPGDMLGVETPEAWYVYEVSERPVMVAADDTSHLAPSPPDPTWQMPATARLATLYTCSAPGWSPWGNSRRAIVHAFLLGWVERSAGVPAEVMP